MTMNGFNALNTRALADEEEQYIQTSIFANWNGFYTDHQTNSIHILDVRFHTMDYLFKQNQLYY